MGREDDNHDDQYDPTSQETISFADLPRVGESQRYVGSGAALFLGDAEKGAQAFPLIRNPTVIGRSNNADLVLPDPTISDYHARIIRHAFGYTVEDMGSAEGTFLGDRRVNHARLVNGDTLRLGNTSLTFVDEPVSPAKGAPKALVPTRRGMLAQRTTVLRAPHSEFDRGRDFETRRPNEPVQTRGLGNGEEPEASLEDVLRKVVIAARYLRQHAVLILVFSVIGLSLGAASFKLLPPQRAARCILTLLSAPRHNPIDPDGQRAQSDELSFFVGAERALATPDSIMTTLRSMGTPNPSESAAVRIGKRMRVENFGDNTYAVAMTPKLFDARDDWHLRFLDKHVRTYVDGEIEKKLKVFVAEVDFLRSQTEAADRRVQEISHQMVKFREANTDQLLAQTSLASSPAELELRRITLTGQISRLSGELDGIRSQLSRGSALSQARAQSRQSDRDAIAVLDRRLAELRAQKFADGHPEVERIMNERKALNRSLEAHLQADATQFERRSNAAYDSLQSQADQLQAQLRAARSELGFIEANRRSLRSVSSEAPKVNARIEEFVRAKDDAVRQHGLLSDRLQKAEVQLRLERVSASSRFEILVPPRLDFPPGRGAFLLRMGIGLGIGLLLAALILTIAWLRKLLAHVAQEMAYVPVVLVLAGSMLLGCAHDGKYVWATDLPVKEHNELIVQPHDTLLIEVQKQPSLSGEFVVREDGHYSQPMGGSIYVADRTTREVATLVESVLRHVVVTPVASVWISKKMPIKVGVVGEVKLPGTYELTRDRTLLTSLAMAGWLTEFARTDRIFVVRPKTGERIRFRLRNITNAELHTVRFQLSDADVVVVE